MTALKKFCIIHNLTRPLSSPPLAYYCDTFLCRLRGLTFRRSLPEGQALLLVQPRENRLDAGIHMLAVGMDLAVAWINNEGVVVDTRLARSWHLAYLPAYPARYILEMNPQRWADYQVGDRVRFEETFLD